MPTPTAHKNRKWDRLEFRLQSAFTYARPSTSVECIGLASFLTQYADNNLTLSTGISIVNTTSTGAGASPAYGTSTLEIPALGISHTESLGASFAASIDARLELDNVRLYVVNSAILEVKWDALRFYVNGSLAYSSGAATVTNATYFAPAGVPIFGIPPKVSWSAAYDPMELLGCPNTTCETVPEEVTDVTTTVDGSGWRYRVTPTGDWVTPPVTVSLMEAPTTSCGESAPSLSSPSATTTYNAGGTANVHRTYEVAYRGRIECNCPPPLVTGVTAQFDVWDKTIERTSYSGSVTLIPDLAKSVKRFGNTEYWALIYRGGSPWTKKQAFAVCDTWTTCDTEPDTTSRSDTESEVHAELTELLNTVGSAPHVIEDLLGYQTVAPADAGGEHFVGTSSCWTLIRPASCSLEGGGAAPDSTDPCFPATDGAVSYRRGTSFPNVQERTGGSGNADMMGYLDHAELIARYVNYIASPHWSYCYWFPANTIDTDFDAIPDAQDQWEVDGGNIPVEYWQDVRSQWLYQALLDPSEQRRTRNHLVSAPLRRSLLSAFMKSYVIGSESSWWGNQVYSVHDMDPATIVLGSDSSGRWSFTDCTASFAAGGITLTPDPGELVIIAELDLDSFAGKPFMALHALKSIKPEWDAANVASVAVTLRNGEGDSVDLGTVSGTTYPRPLGTDSKYAGSYAQDFTAGYSLTDEGTDDIAGEGRSTLYMATEDKVLTFELLAGREAARLRFTITVVSDAATMLLKYPTFSPSADNHALYVENGCQNAIVWPSGPGIRFGNWAYFYGGTMNDQPEVFYPGVPPLYWKSSGLDVLGFSRNVFQQKAATDGTLTELAALFDSYEGNSYADVDAGTIGFLVPRSAPGLRGVMVPTLQVPPLASMPMGARDTSTLVVNEGTPAQEAWSMVEERGLIVSNQAVHLFDGATQWTALLPGTPADWAVASHQHAVDNTESGFKLKRGSRDIATVRPWRGAFVLRAIAGTAGAGVHLDAAQFGLMIEPSLSDDGLGVVLYNVEEPPNRISAAYPVNADSDINTAQIVAAPNGSWFIVYDRTGTGKVYLTRSFTLGETWGAADELMTGTHPAACIDPKRGIECIAVHVAGSPDAWKLYVKLAESEAFNLAGNIVTGVSEGCAGLEFSPERGRPLVFTCSDSGTVRRFATPDLGTTWTEITL